MKDSDSFSPIRHLIYPGNILLIDGLTGTGKTMIMRIVSGLENTYFPKFDYTLEHICVLHFMGQIDLDTAIALIRLRIDQTRYDQELSREVNFRIKDLSSVLRSPNRHHYLLNLFKSDLELSKLENEPKTLSLITHQLLDSSKILDFAYPDKIYRILCVRHPLYLYNHWNSYIALHTKSVRDFTLWFGNESMLVPWFISHDKSSYYSSDNNSKSALAIATLVNQTMDFTSWNREKTIVIDFENFVLEPEPYITRIVNLFPGSSSKILKLLKKENVPRIHINKSITNKIYTKYHSNKLKTNETHENHYNKLKDEIFSSINSEAKELLKVSIERYENTFGLWF